MYVGMCVCVCVYIIPETGTQRKEAMVIGGSFSFPSGDSHGVSGVSLTVLRWFRRVLLFSKCFRLTPFWYGFLVSFCGHDEL